jgi:hypothetical protein
METLRVGSDGIAGHLRCAVRVLCCDDVVLFASHHDNSNQQRLKTKNHAETDAVLSGLKEQQALTNSKLDAIQNELRALNQKAAGAANVTPPPQATPEAAGAPRAGGRLSR